MVSSNEFKNGMTIIYEGNIYQILEFQHVKPGKGGAFVRTKLKNMRSGAIIDYTFNAGEKVEKAEIEKLKMQYIYESGNFYVFMDQETYEQIEIDKKQIKQEIPFISEGLIVDVLKLDQEILGVILPDKVSLLVTQCEPAVKGDTKTSATKDAIVETGHLIKVPLFIMQGEKVIINTQTGEYVQRDKN